MDSSMALLFYALATTPQNKEPIQLSPELAAMCAVAFIAFIVHIILTETHIDLRCVSKRIERILRRKFIKGK